MYYMWKYIDRKGAELRVTNKFIYRHSASYISTNNLTHDDNLYSPPVTEKLTAKLK